MISKTKTDVLIVGAGASGIGMGILLKRIGLNFQIIEKRSIGNSFKRWPEEMKMISPSFTGNFFSMPDLNAITPDSSPAYSLLTEHPTGKQYANYLNDAADAYELPIKENITVVSVKKKNDTFIVNTNNSIIEAKYVIWAAGEFQYPNDKPFDGAQNCIHTSTVKTWSSFTDDSYIVIGAYESGIDAAYQLSKNGKKVIVLDAKDELNNLESDSSYSLSPFTRDRYKAQKKNIEVIPNMKVTKVIKISNFYEITTESGEKFTSTTKPFMATGFKSSITIVENLFEIKKGIVQITKNDESTKCKGLFLVGPQVRHKNAIFCFIYKFRQRFPIVAQTIARRMKKQKVAKDIVLEYKLNNFYLKNLSCCDKKCVC